MMPNQQKINHFIGTVVRGDRRGTKIGFPTANLKLHKQSPKPANGIYACLAQILPDKTIYRAILHVGPRPTFEGAASSIEVHLMDFPYRKLYGSDIKIFSLYFIRQIKKFSNSKELVSTLTQDTKTTHQLLDNLNHEEQTT
jgi:riboflavin kinase/FMN adenylyltransferase